MPTVLDAFLVTLGLDNSGFKKESEKTLSDLEKVKQKAKETAEKVKEEGEKGKEFFKGMTTGALEFFGVMGSLGAMVSFIHGTLEAQVSAGRLAKTLGVDVEEIEALEGAVKRFGGSAEGMDASLKGLNSRLAMIEIHGPRSKMALKLFAGLGISEVALKGKDATQVMGMLAEKMQGMSGAKAMALGERLGLDEGTIRLLQTGKDAVAELTGQIRKNVSSAEQVEAAEKFEQTMLKVKGSMAAVGRQLMSVIMPALQATGEALGRFGAWARDNGTVVKAALVGIAVGFLAVKASSILAAAASAIAWIVATLPLILLIAAIAAVAGGITYLYLKFGTFATIFSILKDAAMAFFAIFEDAWDLVVGIFTGNGEKIKGAFKAVCKDIGHFFSEVALLIVYSLLKAFFVITGAGAKMWAALKDAAMAALGWIEGKLAKIGNFVIKVASLGMAGGGPQLAAAGAGASAGMALRPSSLNNSSSTDNSQRQTTIGSIQIQTQATDAKGLAAELPGAIKSHGLVDQADGGF